MKYNASVIINTYKENEDYLNEAIKSYLNQVGVNIQLIISTVKGDNAINIAQQYKEIDLCISEDPGIYSQLNKAVFLVKNNWFAYASGNDVAYPHKMYKEINTCVENEKLVCYSAFDVVKEKLAFKDGSMSGYQYTRRFFEYKPKLHLKGNFINDCATMHRFLLEKYRPFKLRWGNHAYWDLWLRIFEGEGNVFAYNDEATWMYRVTKNSSHIKRANNRLKREENEKLRIKMLETHRSLII